MSVRSAPVVAVDFLEPGRLWLLVLVVALAAGYVAVLRWRRRTQVRFTKVELLDSVAPSRASWQRHVVAGLQLLGLAVAVVAIARPVERTSERTETEGRIVMLFDVSLSMMATDVTPDRFTAAQDAALEFVDEVDDNVEVGLLSFAGTVNTEVPLTLDRERLAAGIDRLELAEATAIGDALSVATRVLTSAADAAGDPGDDADDDRPPGVIVLLTDGETTVGRPTMVGAQEAADAGIPVYAISFGTPTGAILDPGGSGQVIPVPIRHDEMIRVAELTGGLAFEAATADALAAAYDDIRESLGETLGDSIEVVVEQTWRWAAAAFALLTLAWALSLWWLRGLV